MRPSRSFHGLSWLGITFLLLAGCGFPKTGAAPGPVTSADAALGSSKWPGVTQASLESGRSAFIANCNGCHGYPELSAIPDAHWPKVMQDMGPKSDLTPRQSDDVLHFVLLARSRTAP